MLPPSGLCHQDHTQGRLPQFSGLWLVERCGSLGPNQYSPGWQPPCSCPLPHPFPPHRPLWKREASGSPCSREGRPVWRLHTRVREEVVVSGVERTFQRWRFQKQQWMAQWMLSWPCPHPVTFTFPGPQPHSQAGWKCQSDARSSLTQGQWQLGDKHSTWSPLSGTTWGHRLHYLWRSPWGLSLVCPQ